MNASQQHRKSYKEVPQLPRRWFPLPKLDGYILREFLIKYSILLLVFIILFILGDVYRDIDEFLSAGAPITQAMQYFIYKLPGNVRFILPISMLLGCMWTMASFGKNMEITAMRASGVSLFRCGMPIFVVGLAVTGVNIYFNEALIPFTNREAERIITESCDGRFYVEKMLAFRSNDLQRRWLFKYFAHGADQEDVTLKTFWSDPMIDQVLLSGSPEQQRELISKIFGSKLDLLDSMPRERMVAELRDGLEGRKVDFSAKKVSYDPESGVWTFNDGSFVSYDRSDESRAAASFGTSIMHPEVKFGQISMNSAVIPERPSDILNAIQEKDDLPTWVIWSMVQRTPDMAEKVRGAYMTVFYYRIAFPWACFLAVFLGIPLATKNERTGSLMAIITAVGVIVAYIVLAQVFLVMGKAGVFNPMFAGVAPTVAFVAYGVGRIYFDRN